MSIHQLDTFIDTLVLFPRKIFGTPTNSVGIEKFVFQSTIKARILATFTIINTFGPK